MTHVVVPKVNVVIEVNKNFDILIKNTWMNPSLEYLLKNKLPDSNAHKI